MPKLSKSRETLKLTLDSGNPDDPIVIVANKQPTVGDMEAMAALDDKGNIVTETLVRIIQSWNFTDDEGQPVEVTAETVGLMPGKSILQIQDKLPEWFSFAEKKTQD